MWKLKLSQVMLATLSPPLLPLHCALLCWPLHLHRSPPKKTAKKLPSFFKKYKKVHFYWIMRIEDEAGVDCHSLPSPGPALKDTLLPVLFSQKNMGQLTTYWRDMRVTIPSFFSLIFLQTFSRKKCGNFCVVQILPQKKCAIICNTKI